MSAGVYVEDGCLHQKLLFFSNRIEKQARLYMSICINIHVYIYIYTCTHTTCAYNLQILHTYVPLCIYMIMPRAKARVKAQEIVVRTWVPLADLETGFHIMWK